MCTLIKHMYNKLICKTFKTNMYYNINYYNRFYYIVYLLYY